MPIFRCKIKLESYITQDIEAKDLATLKANLPALVDLSDHYIDSEDLELVACE